MKLFPRQNLWAGNTAKFMTLEGNIALLYPRMLTNDRFQLYYRGQIESQLCWDSRETKLTVSRANSH